MKYRLLIPALLLPLTAFGQPGPGFGALRWDYVGASIAVPELDELGIEVEGSTAVTERLVVFGSYRDFKPDGRYGRETLQIGVGYLWDLRPNLDFLLSASYGDNDIERPGPDRGEEGLILAGHFRGWLTARFELNGAVMLDNSIGSNTDTILELGGQYHDRANLSYGGRVRVDENDTAIFLGVRFYFGASRR
jgi:hypothetical protein